MQTRPAAASTAKSSPSGRISRRELLGGVAATAALTIVPRHVLGGPGHVPPSEKLTLAGIGVGGQGMQNMVSFLQFPEVQVTAVCDVNRESGGYISWNWTQGKEQKTAGRDPAQRAVNECYAQDKRSGKYRGCRATPRLSRAAGPGEGRRRNDRHARPCACRDHHGRHQAGQTRVLREAAGLHGLRNPAGDRSRTAGGRSHAVGQPWPGHRGSPGYVRVHHRRRHRAGPRGARLVAGPLLGARPVAGPSAGNAAGAGRAGLGFVARPGPRAALPSGLLPLDLAQLVGFRHRVAGRPGLPQAFDRVQSPEAG